MKVYRAMFEQHRCQNTPPCQTNGRSCAHSITVMLPDGPIDLKRTGPQQRATSACNRGVFAMVFEAELSEWKPMLTEDEQAVLRVSGPKALRKMLDAKDRQINGPGKKSQVKHGPAPDRPEQTSHFNGKPVTYVWCVCGRLWSHRCSKLKRVIAEQAKVTVA